MKQAIKKSLYIGIAAVAFLSVKSHACSCAQPQPVQEALQDSTAVFLGTVTEVVKEIPLSGFPQVKVVLSVQKQWKGLPWHQTIAVRTSTSGASCGYPFQRGNEYLVYASLDQNGMLQTNICTRTKARANAEEDLVILGD